MLQILNIVAVVITEAFATQSEGDEKKEGKTVYIAVISKSFCIYCNFCCDVYNLTLHLLLSDC